MVKKTYFCEGMQYSCGSFVNFAKPLILIVQRVTL